MQSLLLRGRYLEPNLPSRSQYATLTSPTILQDLETRTTYQRHPRYPANTSLPSTTPGYARLLSLRSRSTRSAL
jgi:hypothetical protein